jgi:hypothetical protein
MTTNFNIVSPIEQLTRTYMRNWILLLCIYPALSEAAEYRLLDTDELYFEYSQLDRNNRDPYAPQYTGRWNERASLIWDSTIVSYRQYRLMWNHNIHTETIDTGAVKTVGWEWRAGVSLGRYLDVFHHHHSKHIMDEERRVPEYGNKGNQFPVEDSLVFRFKFVTSKERQ